MHHKMKAIDRHNTFKAHGVSTMAEELKVRINNNPKLRQSLKTLTKEFAHN